MSKHALSFLVANAPIPTVAHATPDPPATTTPKKNSAMPIPVPMPVSTTPSSSKGPAASLSAIDSLAMVAAAASYAGPPTGGGAIGSVHPARPGGTGPILLAPRATWSESSAGSSLSGASIPSVTDLAVSDLHVLAMGGSGPHLCTQCGCGFAQKLRLLYHLRSAHGVTEHTGKKIISCTLCESAFLRNTDLKKHLACVHEKKRPHACKATGCSSRFFFAKDLKKHISTVHERNKPFECPKCGQKFGKREHMTSHARRVHEKLKPYSCTICKVPLASKYNLQGHLRTFSHKQKVNGLKAAQQLALEQQLINNPTVAIAPAAIPLGANNTNHD